MAKIEKVDKMLQNGTRVTFTMQKDAKPDEAVLARSVKANKLEFVSLKKETRPRAVAAYVADCPKFT
ncbi:MAG: hypothetical protein QF903_07300 [Planctomycetota bacterium]|jgi:hypothetical protein|nr:hypothetical protein [Planctomycetota bacterium]MDP6762455.1 hypothetical protein [Planctomycetota bacterium]MDP6989271.1 hypothetical protein [Planctomycetota bacterium]